MTVICLYLNVFQKRLADIISVLAMTQPEGRECLEFRIKGSSDALDSWGHEYVRWECVYGRARAHVCMYVCYKARNFLVLY